MKYAADIICIINVLKMRNNIKKLSPMHGDSNIQIDRNVDVILFICHSREFQVKYQTCKKEIKCLNMYKCTSIVIIHLIHQVLPITSYTVNLTDN